MYYQFRSIYGTDKTVLKVENGIITAMYDEAELRARIPSASDVTTIEGHAYPGFNDSHMHLVGTGKKLADFNASQCKSISAFQDALRNYIEQTERTRPTDSNSWILGRGWNQDVFIDGRLPNRNDLDAVRADIPIAIHRVCGHIAVLNTAALRKCGFLSEDGQIDQTRISEAKEMGGDLDLEHGTLTGIVREMALNLLPITYTEETIQDYVQSAQRYLFSLGITSVQSDDLYFSEDWRTVIKLFQTMEENGDLKIRVYEQSQVPSVDCLRQEYRQERARRTNVSNADPSKCFPMAAWALALLI